MITLLSYDTSTKNVRTNLLISFYRRHKWQLLIFFVVFIPIGSVKLFFPGLTQNTGADEFGTIAGAAYFAGKNWSGVVSLFFYYGFGYTALMFPFFMFGFSPSVIHILMLLVNTACLAFCGVICYNMMTKLLNIENHKLSIIASITAACFFPNNIFATNTVANESMLILLNWIVLYLCLTMIDRKKLGKNNILQSIILSLLLCYGNLVHTRALFIWGAVALTLISHFIINRNSFIRLRFFLPSLALFYYIVDNIVNYIQSALWLSDGEVIVNTVEGVGRSFSNALYVLNTSGFIAMFRTIVGQMYGVFCFTTGLAFFLILFTFFCFVGLLSKKSRVLIYDFIKNNQCMFLAIMYTTVQIIVIISLTAFVQAPNISGSRGAINAKWLLYNRYWAASAAPVVPLVFALISKLEKNSINLLLKASVVSIIAVNILFSYLNAPQIYGRVNSVSGVYYAYSGLTLMEYGDMFTPSRFLLMTLLSGVITLISYLLIYKRKYVFVSVLALILFVYNYSYVTIKFQIPISQEMSREFLHVDKLLKDADISSSEHSIHARMRNMSLMNLQFSLYDRAIIPIRNNNVLFIDTSDMRIYVDDNLMSSFTLVGGSHKKIDLGESGGAAHVFVIAGNTDLTTRIETAGYSLSFFDRLVFEPKSLYYLPANHTDAVTTEIPYLLAQGDIQFGPYITLPAGMYEVTVIGSGLSNASFSATYANGSRHIDIDELSIGNNMVTYNFTSRSILNQVEFLTSNESSDFVEVESIQLRILERFNDIIRYNANDLYYLLHDDREISSLEMTLYSGETQFGPYITLPAGVYRVSVQGSNLEKADFWATVDAGTVLLEIYDVGINNEIVTYYFEIQTNQSNVEFVAVNVGDGAISIKEIVLERVERGEE